MFTEGEPCVECKSFFDIVDVYMFVLEISDSTGTMDVMLCFEDAQTFLLSTLPEKLRLEWTKVQNVLDNLLQPECWMDCCIRSYNTHDETRVFRVFDTFLR